MTVEDVLTDVRRELRDTDPNNYRWPDATLWRYLGDAERMIKRWRPDLFLQTNNTMSTTAEYTANGGTTYTPITLVNGVTAHTAGDQLSPFLSYLQAGGAVDAGVFINWIQVEGLP